MSDSHNSPSLVDSLLTDDDNLSLELLLKSAWLIGKIVGPLAVGAVVLSFIFFSWKIAIIATAISFMLMLFIAIPLVLATYEDEVIEGGGGH